MPKHIVRAGRRSFAKRLRREQTAPEILLWHELRDRRLGGWKFRRQVSIEEYIVDFVCLDARLIVEIDGPLHSQSEQRAKDEKRDDALRRQGFRILRFDADVGAGRMVDAILRVLSSPESPGSVPLTRPSANAEGHPLPPRGEGGSRVSSSAPPPPSPTRLRPSGFAGQARGEG